MTETEGEGVHATTVLSKAQLEKVRQLAHLEEAGRLIDTLTGDTWRIGQKELLFGKGGLEIQGAGVGGTAKLRWNGSAHEIEKTGGLFFKVKVNGTEVKSSALSPGDLISVGKSEFKYEV